MKFPPKFGLGWQNRQKAMNTRARMEDQCRKRLRAGQPRPGAHARQPASACHPCCPLSCHCAPVARVVRLTCSEIQEQSLTLAGSQVTSGAVKEFSPFQEHTHAWTHSCDSAGPLPVTLQYTLGVFASVTHHCDGHAWRRSSLNSRRMSIHRPAQAELIIFLGFLGLKCQRRLRVLHAPQVLLPLRVDSQHEP